MVTTAVDQTEQIIWSSILNVEIWADIQVVQIMKSSAQALIVVWDLRQDCRDLIREGQWPFVRAISKISDGSEVEPTFNPVFVLTC